MGYRFTLGLWLPAVADENQILKLDFLQEEGAGWIFLWSDYAIFQQLGRNLDLQEAEENTLTIGHDMMLLIGEANTFKVYCLIIAPMMTKEVF